MNNIMKRIRLFIPAAVLTIIFGCSSTKNTTSVPDDVYYSSGDKAADPQPASAVTPSEPSNYSTGTTNYQPDQTSQYSQSYEESQPQSNSEQHNDGNGNTYITNNYYNDDDYYDYQYSARLKRYYSPAIGYGYYDPFYTNSYWYDYNPYDYGVSIYLGYNWWAPSYCYYDPFWYGPVNPHFHNHYYGYYDYWYSPYGYYGYNDYWNGYHDGYWNGYYNGYYAGTYNNPYYYNSYDVNSTYYGPRGSISANGRTTIPSPRATLGEKYQKALVDHKNPILNPKGADGVHTIPVSGIGRGNTTSGTIPVGSKTETRPVHPKDDIHDVKNPVTTEPIRNPISVKNETGGKNDFSTKQIGRAHV